jgi:Protein of unknown function (DUF3306)
MTANDGDPGFLSRWSRRKVQARQGETPAEGVAPTDPVAPAAAVRATPATQALPTVAAQPAQPIDPPPAACDTAAASAPPPPTLADVAALTRESDFSRFVAPGVEGDVKNAALKKLFGDPHFNVMDGLDTYIDDYGKPDPLPASMVRQMAQAAFLGLIEAEPPPTQAAAIDPATQAPKSAEVTVACPSAGTTPEPHEDADLRLQPHDAAGCGGAEDSAAAGDPSQL